MTEFFEMIKGKLSQLYFIAVATILTLYVHDGYLDMIRAKGNMLIWLNVYYIVAMIMAEAVTAFSGSHGRSGAGKNITGSRSTKGKKKSNKTKKSEVKHNEITKYDTKKHGDKNLPIKKNEAERDIDKKNGRQKNGMVRKWIREAALYYCVLAFAVISVVSALLSDKRQDAFMGTDGCYVGALSICLCALSFIFMYKYLEINHYMIIVMAVSGIIVYLGGVTDCFDLDLMKWHSVIAQSHYDFLSTIGNRDYFDGYLALMLPFFTTLFLFEKKIKLCILYGVHLVLGFMNLYIVKNDGNLLVFGAGIFLVYYIIREQIEIKRVVYLLLIFIAASVMVEGICILVDPVNVIGHSIMGKLLMYHWEIGLLLMAALFWGVQNLLKKVQNRKRKGTLISLAQKEQAVSMDEAQE